MNRKPPGSPKFNQQLFDPWCAPIFSLLIALGWLAIAHFWTRASGIPNRLSKRSIIGAILLVCVGGPAFTQSGLFANHGLLAFYLPMVIWGAWLDLRAWYLRRALLRQSASA